MKTSLRPGLTHTFKFKVPESKTVPYLYPESPEFQEMPKVLATGFMVGLFEWTCIQAVNPYLDWPEEQTVGIGLNLNHLAATPPGLRDVALNGEVRLQDISLSFDDREREIHLVLNNVNGRLTADGRNISAEIEANVTDG